MNHLKRRIFQIIQPSAEGHDHKLGRAFDFTIMSLIFLSVAAVFAGTFALPAPWINVFAIIEVTTAVIFSIEYLLRVWTANLMFPALSAWKARLRYMCSGLAIIDLLAVLPFWMVAFPFSRPGSLLSLRILRLLRLFRLFKLNRYLEALQAVGEVFREKAHQLLASLFFVAVLIIIASLMMYSLEHDAQPNTFRNAFSGLWWAVVTLTTVGYGDIYPITVPGRLLGAVIAILGVGMVAIPTGILSAGFVEHLNRKRQKIFDASDRDQLKDLLRETLRETLDHRDKTS